MGWVPAACFNKSAGDPNARSSLRTTDLDMEPTAGGSKDMATADVTARVDD